MSHARVGAGPGVDLHRCGFLEYDELAGVVCVSSIIRADTAQSVGLVVARVDGSLEVRTAPAFQTTFLVPGVAGDAPHATITAVAAVQTDLEETSIVAWVAGADGRAVAWDPSTREVRALIDVPGGVIWDMACFVDPARKIVLLATASEDGRARVYDVSSAHRSHDIPLLCTSPKAAERCLSLCWAPCGGILYVGDADGGIRKISVSSGRPSQTFHITERGEGCLIWAMTLVDNGQTLVAGDSRGTVSLWDTVLGSAAGTMGGEYKIEALAGDITALVATANGKAVFVGAANGGVGAIRKSDQAHGEWSVHRARLIHATDVRSICRHNQKIIVGGLDGRISVIRPKKFFEEDPIKRLFPIARRKVSLVSSPDRTVLSRHRNHLDLWQFSAAAESQPPRLILRVKPQLIGGPIVTGAMDPHHTILVVSGPDRTRAFAINPESGGNPISDRALTVVPIREHPAEIASLSDDFSPGETEPVHQVCSTNLPNTAEFVGIAKNGDSCILMAAVGTGFGVVARWKASDFSSECGSLLCAVASPGGGRLAITDGRHVFVLSRQQGFSNPIGGLAISERDPDRFIADVAWATNDTFAIVTVDKRVKVYDCNSAGEFSKTEWTTQSDAKLMRKSIGSRCRPEGLCFLGPTRLVLYGHDFVHIMSTSQLLTQDDHPREPLTRKRKHSELKSCSYLTLPDVQNVMGVVSFGSDELMVADYEWQSVVDKLPYTMPKKAFQ